jgi:hypothetical protein
LIVKLPKFPAGRVSGDYSHLLGAIGDGNQQKAARVGFTDLDDAQFAVTLGCVLALALSVYTFAVHFKRHQYQSGIATAASKSATSPPSRH